MAFKFRGQNHVLALGNFPGPITQPDMELLLRLHAAHAGSRSWALPLLLLLIPQLKHPRLPLKELNSPTLTRRISPRLLRMKCLTLPSAPFHRRIKAQTVVPILPATQSNTISRKQIHAMQSG